MRGVSGLILAMLVLSCEAFWRMNCKGNSAMGLIDPIVHPGQRGHHAHVLFGGSNIGMNATGQDLLASSCTTCQVVQDKSAYWTPIVYWQHSDGTFQAVPQTGGAGVLVYYELHGANIEAFPVGFRMIVGDNFRRSVNPSATGQEDMQQRAISFTCLNGDGRRWGTEGFGNRHQLPTREEWEAGRCEWGVRFELQFPSCWNGELDAPDHKSHVAFPSDLYNGACPDTHPRRLPALKYENVWRLDQFRGMDGRPVMSNGDPTGLGYHGDFLAAWDVKVLQRAINECTSLSGLIEECGHIFNLQPDASQQSCSANADTGLPGVDFSRPGGRLPGNVPIAEGPERAPPMDMAGESMPGVDAAMAPDPPHKEPALTTKPIIKQQPEPTRPVIEHEQEPARPVIEHKPEPTRPVLPKPAPVEPTPEAEPAELVEQAPSPTIDEPRATRPALRPLPTHRLATHLEGMVEEDRALFYERLERDGYVMIGGGHVIGD